MTKNIIKMEDISKVYDLRGKNRQIKALDNVNISIQEGEIFGLLGPNGAGKTTLISIPTTLIQPTSGKIFMDGFDIVKESKKVKPKFSLMMDYKLIYNRITAYDNLKFICKLYKIHDYEEKINKIVKDFGIEDWLDQYVSTFSTGMKMKLALCRTLLLDRDIMILDEPTLGLDVKAKAFIINKLKDSDKTILLTSHDMHVVEELCDRIAFINKGKILKTGTRSEISKLSQKKIQIFVDVLNNRGNLIERLNSVNYITKVKENSDGLKLFLRERTDYKDLLSILKDYDVVKIKEKEPSLEELFLKVIK